MIHAQGRLLFTNTTGARLVGADNPAQLVGRFISEFVHPDDRRMVNERIKLLEAGHSVPFVEEKWLRLDGSVVDVAVAATPVVLRDDGERPAVQVIALDITGHKQHERELARWNAELEHRVAERTAQLEAANQELEAFSYSVSHDLRAPLRHIDGFVEILQSHAVGQLDEEGRHHLQTIAEAAKKMGKLIDDLLAFSRMSRLRMNKRSVDLGTLVQEILRPLQRDLKGRQVEWIIGDLPQVEADLDMLRQVLFNLIDNALKYTRTRSVARIEIGATTAADEITFFIRDNGVGFDMRYIDKLFGVFQRLHRSNEFEGTGVGLANVRRIIHRHGGRTWAEGSVNAGATFYFSLPRPTTPPASPPSPS
ncbi:MAG: Histidine kinase [Pedosphaera sp.]|nr:Histidine kinase [Pedosphaera sp.]